MENNKKSPRDLAESQDEHIKQIGKLSNEISDILKKDCFHPHYKVLITDENIQILEVERNINTRN